MKRRRQLTLLVLAVILIGCGSGASSSGESGTAGTAAEEPATTIPSITGSAGSCALEFNKSTLRDRAWAFDRTVESIGVTTDSRLGAVPSATFAVRRWYKGGVGDRVTIQYDAGAISELAPSAGVGNRMLVSGEPRWGGQPLDDPVAWGCGFSSKWTETTERTWTDAFS